MRRLLVLALLCLLLPAAASAQDSHAALRRALQAALDGWPAITRDAPDAATLHRRLTGDRATLSKLEQRRADLDHQIALLDGRIATLQHRLTSDPGSYETPRDQVTLLALQDQRETTQNVRQAIAQTIGALAERIAQEQAQLLAVEGGRAALEQRLAQLKP